MLLLNLFYTPSFLIFNDAPEPLFYMATFSVIPPPKVVVVFLMILYRHIWYSQF